MKRVKITDGLYGYRPKGAKHPQPAPAGSLCIVTDAEAARLASIGVGVVLEDIPEEDITGAVATPVEGAFPRAAFSRLSISSRLAGVHLKAARA